MRPGAHPCSEADSEAETASMTGLGIDMVKTKVRRSTMDVGMTLSTSFEGDRLLEDNTPL